jgi:hypothetical protein
MISLVHYDNEKIHINGKEYRFDDFKKLEPQYSVPWGFHTRVYEHGKKHYITDGNNTIHLRPIDAECDRICNREGELARLVAMLQREASGKNS